MFTPYETIDTVEEKPFGHWNQRLYNLPNGYNVSQVRHGRSYGNRNGEGLWEVSVRVPTEDGLQMVRPLPEYDHDDIIGWLTEQEVQTLLQQIADLPPYKEEKE